MVRLTITPALVAALEHSSKLDHSPVASPTEGEPDEPSLEAPAVGDPITHSQVLALSKRLRQQSQSEENVPPHDLDTLLRGSRVYVEPPKPKPEPTDEFKTLMARLRAEEEERKYHRMLNAPAPTGPSFSQQFPNSPYAHLFPDSQPLTSTHTSSDPGGGSGVLHDELTMRDVNRQLALIGNVLVSIVACGVAIWWATWHWPTGWRLGVSMGGSGLVGVAEVVVYLGYVERMSGAKEREGRRRERKTVRRTWVIEGRKGVVERRVVGGGDEDKDKDKVVTGAEWVDVPASMRQRGRGK